VSFVNPAKLQILDMNCYLLTTIDGKNNFKNPYYVTSNRNAIYVSDVNMNILTKINWHCKVTGSYSRTGKPRGMALSEDGTVFVCDKERNVIEEIMEDCSTGKVLLKTVKSPYAVCWCGETQKLYYSCYAEDEKINNFLHMYKLS
jgi:DNA-binding beta-propeller fold protein YncE